MLLESNQSGRNHAAPGTKRRTAVLGLTVFLFFIIVSGAAIAAPPGIGATAPDFTLSTPNGASVTLANQAGARMTVLVFLRGFPGYQCPYCQKQVHDFVEHASDFAANQVNVVLVYPGPPAELDERAKEFLAKQPEMPPIMKLVIDPDYKVTNLYGLRWDAPHETAYPSTFILDKDRKIMFQKISHSHGDRTTAAEVLAQIPAK